MRRLLHQIRTDIRRKRHLDLYATALVTLIFAAVLIVGAGILVLRTALAGHREDRFLDRSDYDRHPITEDLRRAKDVWIFAPVGSNFLTEERCEVLRSGPLAKKEGSVRVVVLKVFDPAEPISEQLDALLDHPVQKAADSLRETRARLTAMERWEVGGTFAYGDIGFNPGFSLVAVNPHSAGGFVNVEFHGFRNDAIRSRMHIRLTSDDGSWYTYWLDQFEAIWRSARESGS